MSFFSKRVSKSAASGSSGSGAARAASLEKKTTKHGAMHQVEMKLRNLERYKEFDGKELQEVVESITTPERILNDFSHLVEHTLVSDTGHNIQKSEAELQGKVRYVQVANIPLKIVVRNSEADPKAVCALHSLGDFIRMDYAAKQVLLVVGDLVLEWGRDSLVIPKREDLPDDSAPVDDTPSPAIFEEVEQMIERTSDGKPIFEELAKVISKYNKSFYYDDVRRNCQTFVVDALKALGIQETIPIVREISERLVQLKEKKLGEIPDVFAQHEDLDAYIKTKSQHWVSHLDPDSLEFLQLLYIQFHGNAACYNPNCQLFILSQALQQHLSKRE